MDRRRFLTGSCASAAAALFAGCSRTPTQVVLPTPTEPLAASPTSTPEQIQFGSQDERFVTAEEIMDYITDLRQLGERYCLPSFTWSADLLDTYLAAPNQFHERFGIYGFSIMEATLDPRVVAYSRPMFFPSDTNQFTTLTNDKTQETVQIPNIAGTHLSIILGQTLREPTAIHEYTDEQKKMIFYLTLSNELMRSMLLLNFDQVAREYYEVTSGYSTNLDSPELRRGILVTLLSDQDRTDVWHFLDGFPYLMQEPDSEIIWKELYGEKSAAELNTDLLGKDGIYSIISRFKLVNGLLDKEISIDDTDPFHVTESKPPEQVCMELYESYNPEDDNDLLTRLIEIFATGSFSTINSQRLTRRDLLAKLLGLVSPTA